MKGHDVAVEEREATWRGGEEGSKVGEKESHIER